MPEVPSFIKRPVQGAGAIVNFLWNGSWKPPEWTLSSAEESKWLVGDPKKNAPRVIKKNVDKIKKAYETLGVDYYKAKDNHEYMTDAFKKVVSKLRAAGVDSISDDSDVIALADAYTKLSDEQKATYAKSDGSAEPQETAPAADQKTAPGQKSVSNGKQKGQGSDKQATATGATPVAPKNNDARKADVVTGSRYDKLSTSDTGVRVDGAPVEVEDTSTISFLKGAQRGSAEVAELQARREAANLRNAMRSDGRQLEQDHIARQDALDASWEARNTRLRAAREAAHKKRMDKRYESRTLTGMSDWENLGRDSTKRDFSDKKEGESDESWNARSGAVGAVEKLRKRFEALGVKDADTNEFYAYNPNRMRDVSGLGGLFNKAVESGNLTDAQIEGLNKTLDMYEDEGRKTKATLQRNAAMRDAENVRKYREMYGMGDRDVFSDDDVKTFHADRQAASRKEILQNMQVAPGQGGEEGRGQRVRDFSDNWMKLVDNGLDVAGTFKKAMSNGANRKAYQEGIAGIAANDPERADKMDQLRRRFVMNQAMTDAGLTDRMVKPTEGQTLGAAMAGDLPGKLGLILSDLQVAGDNAPNAGVSRGATDAAKANGAEAATAPATDGLKPRKKGDTQQVAKGGMVLRPRRRAS